MITFLVPFLIIFLNIWIDYIVNSTLISNQDSIVELNFQEMLILSWYTILQDALMSNSNDNSGITKSQNLLDIVLNLNLQNSYICLSKQ